MTLVSIASPRAAPSLRAAAPGYRIRQDLVPTPLMQSGERPPVQMAISLRRTLPGRMRMGARIARFLLKLIGMRIRGKRLDAKLGHELANILQEMGGLMVKVGQLLSLRPDVFSPEFCDVLTRLQFKALGFPSEEARHIIEMELGCPIEEVFDVFEDQPMAAASIAQVHRAHLRREDVWVVVKVQRPNVKESFDRDLSTIRRYITRLESIPAVAHLGLDEMMDELEQVTLEEVDYRYEAFNTRRMRRTLRKHKIYVPKIYDYSTRRLLVMEFVPGVLMTDIIELKQKDPARLEQWMRENEIEPEKLGRRLFMTFQRQLFEDNLFHGDLHPGNILVLRGGRVSLIDFGSIGTMDANVAQLFRAYTRAVGERDFKASADFLMLLTERLPMVDTEAFRPELARPFRAWAQRATVKALPYKEKSIANAAMEASEVILKYKIVLTWQFMKMNRASLTLDASLVLLLADVDYIKLMQRYFKGAERRASRSLSKRVSTMITSLQQEMDFLGHLVGRMARNEARAYRNVSSKGARVMTVVFRYVEAVALALTPIVILGFFRPDWFPFGLNIPALDTLVDIARLNGRPWLALGILIATVYFSQRVQEYFSRPEIPT